jgi:hypothetical protein
MAASARKRRKRRSTDYRPPTTRREAREASAPAPPRPARTPSRRRGKEDRPPSPWGSFPLVELTILLSLVLLVVGFFMGNTRGVVMLVAGISLGSLAALELTLREHFYGYRSHTTLLAGVVGVLVLGVGFVLAWPQLVKVGGAAGAFLISFYLFREAFKRRSGGLGWR